MTTILFRRTPQLCCVLLLWVATAHAAEDSPGVKLLLADSLAGWDHGAKPPANWIISDGRLTGNSLSTPLLSGWTVGDFELRLQWSVSSTGVCTLGFPDVPAGPGLQVTLKEGDGCGAVRDGDATLAAGVTIDAPSGDAMHSAAVRRFGSTLSVVIDGRVAAEAQLDRNRRFGIALGVPTGEASLDDLRLEEPRGNPLFNGKDLTGWHVNNKNGAWTVDGGDIIPTFHTGLHYLRTDREYANFTWSFEYTISKGGNSGVAIRTAQDGWPSGDGMELQILDRPGLVKDSNMAIYGNLPPLVRADRSGEWNRAVVKADGRMVTCWVNGDLVQQANTAWLPEVKHRHLKGWVGVQDHGGKVRFREIYLHEAPDGLGLDAWYQPRTESGAYVALDRLMNSERLSRDDGVSSGVVAKSVPKGGEHVLAELAGPGALVRLWQECPSGRMAFYFDGEETPRIECAAEHVADSVPSVAHEQQPALMCLPYEKSLKIVVTDPLEVAYRLDYVTFPPGMPVESYSVARPGIPRGMLEAISYRHQGLTGGKLREAEIYERINTQPRTIEPGTSVELARLDGAGLVNWLKLNATRAALANDDLWLEVTVDGEAVPAIAAPARFLFPAFAGSPSSEFQTLVMAGRDGFANLLAMPYGAGFTVAARNRGEKPIENVAVSLSVDRASGAKAADYAGRMRLRGVFQAADSLSENLVQALGGGRWVSLVYEQPEGGATGIASLVADGQPRDGWSMADLDPFWGRPGESENFYCALSGRSSGLAWRYLLAAPVSFEQSLVLKPNPGAKLGGRLALFYLKR
jgi:3-keto-disaccharide hydrolase